MYKWVEIFNKNDDLIDSFFRIVDEFELHVTSLGEAIPVIITLYQAPDGSFWARPSHYPVPETEIKEYEFMGSVGESQENALENLINQWKEHLGEVSKEKIEWVIEHEYFN